MLISVSCHCTAGDDLNGLLNGHNLVCAQLLPGFKVGCFLLTCCGQVCQVFHISIPRCGGVFQIACGVSLGLQLCRFSLSLLISVLRCLCDLCLQVLHEHVVGMLAVHLFLLQSGALIYELIQQFLQHLDHTT